MRKKDLPRTTLAVLAAVLVTGVLLLACQGANSPTAPEAPMAASPEKSVSYDSGEADLTWDEETGGALGPLAEKAGGSIDVCHIPPGNPANRKVIRVGAGAVPAHLAHGDNLYGDEICDGLDNDCDGAEDEDEVCGDDAPRPSPIGAWNPQLPWLEDRLVAAINAGIAEINGLLDEYRAEGSSEIEAEIYPASDSLAMSIEALHEATTQEFPRLSVSEREALVEAFQALVEILERLFNKANEVLEIEGRDVWWITLQQTGEGQPVLFGGGGSGTRFSSRTLKTDFVPVETREILERVLELPLSIWSYQWDEESRHLGPMAEDFRAAFGLGRSEKVLWPLDTSGVALAAIQGLSEVVAEREREFEELRLANEQLVQRLEALEQAPEPDCREAN